MLYSLKNREFIVEFSHHWLRAFVTSAESNGLRNGNNTVPGNVAKLIGFYTVIPQIPALSLSTVYLFGTQSDNDNLIWINVYKHTNLTKIVNALWTTSEKKNEMVKCEWDIFIPLLNWNYEFNQRRKKLCLDFWKITNNTRAR